MKQGGCLRPAAGGARELTAATSLRERENYRYKGGEGHWCWCPTEDGEEEPRETKANCYLFLKMVVLASEGVPVPRKELRSSTFFFPHPSVCVFVCMCCCFFLCNFDRPPLIVVSLPLRFFQYPLVFNILHALPPISFSLRFNHSPLLFID